MSFRIGVAIGAAVGFLIGLEVGHRRYAQIQAVLERVGVAEPVSSVAGVGRDLLDGTTDAAKTLLGEQLAEASRKIRSFAGDARS